VVSYLGFRSIPLSHSRKPTNTTKDIEIKLSHRTLVVKGEKRKVEENKSRDYYFSERRYGSFMRSFELPDGIDTAKIEASFSKGVLKIRLPKSAEAQKNEKKIEIKAT